MQVKLCIFASCTVAVRRKTLNLRLAIVSFSTLHAATKRAYLKVWHTVLALRSLHHLSCICYRKRIALAQRPQVVLMELQGMPCWCTRQCCHRLLLLLLRMRLAQEQPAACARRERTACRVMCRHAHEACALRKRGRSLRSNASARWANPPRSSPPVRQGDRFPYVVAAAARAARTASSKSSKNAALMHTTVRPHRCRHASAASARRAPNVQSDELMTNVHQENTLT